MVLVRGSLAVIAVVAATRAGFAQPKAPSPPLVGATELLRLAPTTGFVDDVVAFDADRLAYVVADAATRSELHVVTLATRAEQVVDLAAVALHPVALELAGPRAFVVGELEDGKQIAALVELADKGKARPAGTAVYKVPAATHITVITRDGKRRVAVHRAAAAKTGTGTRHEVELLAFDTGARLGAARALELDDAGTSKQLDFRLGYWSDGWTRARGIKGGEWDRKENQRSPDSEATYDLVAGKLVDRTQITDLFDQRRRFQALADAGGRIDLVRIDGNAVQIWKAGKPRTVELDQPLSSYDPKSLQGVVSSDGSAWIVLKVDPVNPDAVARQKADPEYLDVFRAAPDGKAVRRGRILAEKVRHRFGPLGPTGDKFWLLERNQGFERGGKTLTVYQLP